MRILSSLMAHVLLWSVWGGRLDKVLPVRPDDCFDKSVSVDVFRFSTQGTWR